MPTPFQDAVDHLQRADATCPRSLRAHAVEAVRLACAADTALFYCCADDGDAQPVTDVVTAGALLRVEEAFVDHLRTISSLNRNVRDLRRVPSRQRTRFHRIDDFPVGYRERFERTEHYARVWTDAGTIDANRLLVYDDDGRFAGWIGGVKTRGSKRFSVRQRKDTQRIARAVRDALVTALHWERGARPNAPGMLVTTPGGEVELASGAARRWLDVPAFREQLPTAIASSRPLEDAERAVHIADARARIYRIVGADGDRIAIHLEPLPAIELSPAADLTAAQRRVAELAAAGLTVPEIGAELGSSPHTVREHLKRTYRILGVANRVELAEALQHDTTAN